MKVRPAKKDDLDDIMSVVHRLQKEYFEKNEIPQWQNGYPSRETFLKDIEDRSLFVMYLGECLIGFASIKYAAEPTYSVIENGNWEKDDSYLVIHRFGINPDWHKMGMGTTLIAIADKICEANSISSIRADTHEKNAGMIALLEKSGFKKRGIIHLENGDPRLAFEKNI